MHLAIAEASDKLYNLMTEAGKKEIDQRHAGAPEMSFTETAAVIP